MNFIKDILNFRSIDFYSNLDQNAQQTLNFDLPTKSIQIGKQISPELYSHYSLGHGETFLGYAFKSERRILYGRIYGDGRLDGVYSNKPYKNVLTLVSGTSSWDSDSHLQFQVISDQRIITNELAWNTDNVLGYSNLVRLTKNWAFGSELFYTFSESSGGMSLGARFQSDAEDVQGTLISNPIMGHIKSNLYKKLSDNLRLATQYDINVYSLHSDVSFGGEYRIPDGGQSIKCKASLQHGIGINLLSRFDWGLLTMGFNLGRTSPTQWGISLEFF